MHTESLNKSVEIIIENKSDNLKTRQDCIENNCRISEIQAIIFKPIWCLGLRCVCQSMCILSVFLIYFKKLKLSSVHLVTLAKIHHSP